MTQDKEAANDEEGKNRHDIEVKLFTDLRTKKQAEKTGLENDLKQIERDFLAKTEY